MRKSSTNRLSDTKAAVVAWRSAGLAGDRRLSFMEECITKLQHGKGLSTKQRAWLDALVAEGPPAPKGDPALLSRIDAALAHLSPTESAALVSLKGTITRGWKLSEKQTSFLNNLLGQAEREAREGRWVPTPDQRARADFAWSILTSRASMWQAHHSGTMMKCRQYDSWRQDSTTWRIDERTVTAITSACAPAMRELANPKFLEGELVWIDPHRPRASRAAAPEDPAESMALVTGGPVALQGHVGYPVLINGIPEVLPGSAMSRKPRASAA